MNRIKQQLASGAGPKTAKPKGKGKGKAGVSAAAIQKHKRNVVKYIPADVGGIEGDKLVNLNRAIQRLCYRAGVGFLTHKEGKDAKEVIRRMLVEQTKEAVAGAIILARYKKAGTIAPRHVAMYYDCHGQKVYGDMDKVPAAHHANHGRPEQKEVAAH